MAADSAVMVIDAAKGIEPQTRKLFKICAMRHIPIFTFINKLDREARSPYDLMEQLENEFGIGTYPMNWPIGCGQDFKGVYDREKKEILAFNEFHRGQSKIRAIECTLDETEKLDELIGPRLRQSLADDIELLDGAGYDFDIDEVPGGCEARCEYCLGMRDEHDVEIGLPDAVDGERYTVDGYRTFFDDIANVVARNCERELFP